MLKKILFSLVIFFTYSNLYASAPAERISFANIQDIYICYENTNFQIARLPSRDILEQEDLTLRYFAPEVYIVNHNKTQIAPVSISSFDSEREAIPTVRNAIWYKEYTPRGQIYASIVLKHSNKIACTGADQENDHTFIVEHIPANQSLTFKLKQIENPEPQDNQVPNVVPHQEGERIDNNNFGFNNHAHIEPANNGLPIIPNVPSNFHPGPLDPRVENHIPENPPAENAPSNDGHNQDGLDANNQSPEEKPLPHFPQDTNKAGNFPKQNINPAGPAEGCSLQLSGNSMANFSWVLWGFVLGSFTCFRKRK